MWTGIALIRPIKVPVWSPFHSKHGLHLNPNFEIFWVPIALGTSAKALTAHWREYNFVVCVTKKQVNKALWWMVTRHSIDMVFMSGSPNWGLKNGQTVRLYGKNTGKVEEAKILPKRLPGLCIFHWMTYQGGVNFVYEYCTCVYILQVSRCPMWGMALHSNWQKWARDKLGPVVRADAVGPMRSGVPGLERIQAQVLEVLQSL